MMNVYCNSTYFYDVTIYVPITMTYLDQSSVNKDVLQLSHKSGQGIFL